LSLEFRIGSADRPSGLPMTGEAGDGDALFL
jgi:hypothetical protein